MTWARAFMDRPGGARIRCTQRDLDKADARHRRRGRQTTCQLTLGIYARRVRRTDDGLRPNGFLLRSSDAGRHLSLQEDRHLSLKVTDGRP